MLKRTLVANRGEIACRILRACREAGIEGVAIHAANDSGTLFTELADIAIQLTGEGLAETYLNQNQILEIAIGNGCDSIHPGFGFLSERADFAQAVMDAGLIWVGPSPEAITKMGDKMTARITMKKAGVPTIPGSKGIIPNFKNCQKLKKFRQNFTKSVICSAIQEKHISERSDCQIGSSVAVLAT